MKAFRILIKNISESFKGVFRNFSLSLASISCITITLIMVGFSILLSYNVNNFTTRIEKDLTIVVFLDREVSETEIESLETRLKTFDNVEKVTFNSREKVKEEMEKESEVFKSIMSQYDEKSNPLQDSFLVKVNEINGMGKTADEIEKLDKVNLVKYGEGSVEELVKIFDLVKKICYIAVAALVLVTIFLVSNTIKITIQSRKREIEIRRLVGASNSFIRRPFFFEGIILGFLGSIIPIVVCCYGYSYLYDKLGGQIFSPIIALIKPANVIYIVLLALLIIGVVVGAFGSYKAVRKYLKI